MMQDFFKKLMPHPSEASQEEMAHRALVRRSITDGSRLSYQFIILNGLAAIIATYGLLANSTAVVIGAMLIAVLMGPIMGLALSLVDNNFRLFVRSIGAEAAGVIVVISLALLIAFVHRDLQITEEVLSRTHPNLLDLIIALTGGVACAYATVNPKVNGGLVGVAIATALVPPLAAAGICFARGNLGLASGALILFVTNLIAIQISASVVLAWLGYHRLFDSRRVDVRMLRFMLTDLVLLIGLSAFLAIQLNRSTERQRFEQDVQTVLKRGLSTIPGAVLADTFIRYNSDNTIVVALVRTPFSVSPQNTKELQSRLPGFGEHQPKLHVRSLITKETIAEGYLHELEPNAVPVEDFTSPSDNNESEGVDPDATIGQP